jgi:transposase
MDNLLMSAKELNRLEVMQKLSEKRMSQKEAGRILNLGVSKIKRLLKAYRTKGAAGLVSKHRGHKGNNRLSEEVRRSRFVEGRYKALVRQRSQSYGEEKLSSRMACR